MSNELIIQCINETMKVALLISAPMLLTGLVAGLIVAVFQAVTQIQEMTLTFIPKIVGVAIALVIFLPWMISMLRDFAVKLFLNIPMYIR